jgi:hypothetical protein
MENSLSAVIENEVELMRHVQTLVRDLISRPSFSPCLAFRTVDRYRVGQVDCVSLGAFLRSNGYNPSEMELLAIIRRIDTNGNATINERELTDFLRASEEWPQASRAYPATTIPVPKQVKFEDSSHKPH